MSWLFCLSLVESIDGVEKQKWQKMSEHCGAAQGG